MFGFETTEEREARLQEEAMMKLQKEIEQKKRLQKQLEEGMKRAAELDKEYGKRWVAKDFEINVVIFDKDVGLVPVSGPEPEF